MKLPNLREIIWISPPNMGGENISSVTYRYMEYIGWRNKPENPCLIYVGSESQIEKGIEAKKNNLGIPLLLNFWGWMPERFMFNDWRSHYNKKVKLIEEYSNLITVPNIQVMEQLRILGVTKEIKIHCPGVDTIGLFISKYETKKYLRCDPYVLSIGRLVPHKNFQTVIEALSGTPYRYIIIGSGESKEELLKLAKERNVSLTISENIDDSNKGELIALAKAVIVSSQYEGFGLPIIEAATLNTPVIASALPVFKELFGDNLEYYETTEELRSKIRSLIEFEPYSKKIYTKEAILGLKYSALNQSIQLNGIFIELISRILKDEMRKEFDANKNTIKDVYNLDALIDKNYFAYRLDPNTPLFFFRADPLLKNLLGETVLDAGSSTGTFALYMAQAGHRVTSIDIAEEYLKLVKSLAEKNNLSHKIDTRLCDILELEEIFAKETFDNIWAGEILEHFEDSRDVIRQLMRVLKNNGRFLLTVPYQDACYDCFHMRKFNTEEDIKNIFKEFPKFEIQEVKKIGSPGGKHNNWFAWGIKKE